MIVEGNTIKEDERDYYDNVMTRECMKFSNI